VADDSPDPDRIATQQDFGRELTAIRTRAGLTVRQVARAAGLPASTAGDYFAGRHLPADGRPEQLFGILRACGETDPDLLARWRSARQRARRSPGRRPGGADAPYRGLARYEREDARWFFGREDVTDLLAALADEEKPLPLVLVGPSGAGKSSLLRAGLIPRLASPVGLLEPTGPTGPLAALRVRLAELDAAADGDGDVGNAAAGGTGRPAVIVDQFEAIFTQCQDEAERREFVTEVCELAKTALVILALRADFYHHALRYPELAAALQARQVVLGPMTAEQVRRAVTEPARLARRDVEEGLVGLLLRDLAPPDAALPEGAGAQAAYQPGALPLLSHAMLATWEHSRGGQLTIADYLASGGISDALTRTAEAAYGSLSADEQRLARRLFLRLVHVADDVPPTRATVRLSDLEAWGGDTGPVLGRFVAERLITVDAETAQITHDALLAAWPRLRSWIEVGRENLLTRRRITEAARAWQDAGRESAALWRGSQLATARDWAADEDNRASLSPLAGEFVADSVAAEQAHERAEHRRTRRLQRLVAALAVLVVAVGALAGFAFQQRHAATAARDDANSREIAVEAGQVRGQDAPLAAQLSVAAYDTSHTPQAAASLLESTGSPSAARLLDSAGVVQSVSLSPDRTLLAVAGADGTLRLWDVASPGHPVPLGAPLARASDSPLYATAFSPDGKILAAAGAGRAVDLWDVSRTDRPVRLGTLTGPANTVYSVAFSPDGRTLAAGSADDTVRLWNVSDPAHPAALGKPLTGAAGYVESVAFAPGGTMLAAGSADDTVWLWNVTDLAHPAPVGGPLTGPRSLVTGVAFSPKGNLLAAASQDHSLWLWRISGGRAGRDRAIPDGTLTGAVNWLNAVAFSPDGTSVAAGTSDASVLVWNLATRALTATLPHPQPVTSLAWDGTGRLVAGDADGTVSLWTLPTPVLLTGNASSGVAYSPDGTTLAVGGQNVQLWNAGRRTLIATRPLPGGTITNSIAYSPSGDLIAIARSDGTAWLLDARTLAPVGIPFRVTATGNAESVAFSPDGKLLATAGDDGTLRLFSLADPARPHVLASVRDSGTYVYTVVFAPDGTTIAAASTDNLTRLWDVADPARPVPLGKPLTGPVSYAIGLAFSPNSALLAVGSADKTVRLWNVTSPAHPVLVGAPLTGPTSYVWAVAFSPDGRTLAAGVTDGTVWLWNVTDPAHPALVATLTGPQGHVFSVAYSPSGRVLAAASNDGTVHLWDTSPAAAEADVCAGAGQPLTRQEWATYIPGVAYRAPC
jgi:WD40 repeat protein/transcriptional regulator with XRE-family HTH domain